jgi:hypothetical protein
MSIELAADLAAPFPRDAISWRAQSLTGAGDKAMALAYIDARDVMRRLDEVCGPFNWSDSYHETPTGTSVCTIAIRCPVDGAWVSKSDGAGATDVEAEKGRLSDAFKRAAVKWGIGRYLYDMPAPWVPCDTYEKGGKKYWKAWKSDPWSFVRNAPDVPAATLARVVSNDTNPGKTDPGGADDLAVKWSAWLKTETEKLKTQGFDREALASWDASNRKYFARCEKYAPDAYAEMLAVIEAMNDTFDRFHPINAG